MKEGTFNNTYGEIEVKTDCRFYSNLSKKKEDCNALKELYCRKEKCNFYKPRKTE